MKIVRYVLCVVSMGIFDGLAAIPHGSISVVFFKDESKFVRQYNNSIIGSLYESGSTVDEILKKIEEDFGVKFGSLSRIQLAHALHALSGDAHLHADLDVGDTISLNGTVIQ